MSDKKISQLTPASTPLAGTETLPIVQSGNTVKATVQDVANLAGAPYKVYTALLTQSGGDGPSEKYQGDEIYAGVTYYISANNDNYDLVQYGAPNSNVGTYFVCNQNATLPLDITIQLDYNSGAPVVTVLQNTIGNITWGYVNIGNYTATLNGAFTLGKTIVFISSFNNSNDYNISARTSLALDTINLFTYGNTGDSTHELDGSELPIEIRVYN